MAATITYDKNGVMGDLKYRIVRVTGDSSYATGGYSLTLSNLALSDVLFQGSNMASGYFGHYDEATQKVLFYRNAAGAGAFAETPNATNIATITVTLFILGK